MKPSNELFLLIKSLNKNEKRYFRLFAERHVIGEENTYLKLFDTISKQKGYDESRIKAVFKKERMGKNLAAEKNRLYHLVLKSLSDFHSGISVEAKLRGYMQRAEVLFEKGLYDQGAKMIKRAKKISLENGKYIYLLELQQWEKRLIRMNYYTQDRETNIEAIHAEASRWAAQYKRSLDVESVFLEVVGFQKAYTHMRKKSEIRDVKKVFSQLRRIKESSLDRVQKIHYYNTLSLYHRVLGNNNDAYKFFLKQRALHRESPVDNTELYDHVSCLDGLALLQTELLKYNDALETIQTIRKKGSLPMAKKSSRIQTLIFKSYSSELCIYMETGDFEKGMAVMKSMQKELEKYNPTLGNAFMFTFWYFFGIVCFGAEEYKKSITWLNKIIQHPEQQVRVDLQCFARILGMIVHYELHNEILLPYYVKSVYRYLLKKQRLFKFETIILEFIRKKIPKINSVQDRKTAFSELKETLLVLKKDPKEKAPFDSFDYLSWLESKIEKRPFADIVKEKADTIARAAQ